MQTRWHTRTSGGKFHAMTQMPDKRRGKQIWRALCRSDIVCETTYLLRPKVGDPPEEEQCQRCARKLKKG